MDISTNTRLKNCTQPFVPDAKSKCYYLQPPEITSPTFTSPEVDRATDDKIIFLSDVLLRGILYGTTATGGGKILNEMLTFYAKLLYVFHEFHFARPE
jgi:hypothetical protein